MTPDQPAAEDPRHTLTDLTLAALGQGRPVTPADAVVEHMARCTDAKAAIVVDGSADDVIADLVRAGWTVQERVDVVAAKRIRFLAPPAPPALTAEDDRDH